MLAALLLHPEREYGTNELISLSGGGKGAGRNVIKEFEASNIIMEKTLGNQVVVFINMATRSIRSSARSA